jgi:hypothetical protein
MILRHTVVMVALLTVISLSVSRTRAEPAQELPRISLDTPWFWGTICFDSDYGRETVLVLLYIEEVRPRGYFIGAMWYPEADEVLQVVGRLTATGYLHWFSVAYPMYSPDETPTARGTRMFFYNNLGYDYGILRAIGGVVTKATWDLQPISLGQEEKR